MLSSRTPRLWLLVAAMTVGCGSSAQTCLPGESAPQSTPPLPAYDLPAPPDHSRPPFELRKTGWVVAAERAYSVSESGGLLRESVAVGTLVVPLEGEGEENTAFVRVVVDGDARPLRLRRSQLVRYDPRFRVKCDALQQALAKGSSQTADGQSIDPRATHRICVDRFDNAMPVAHLRWSDDRRLTGILVPVLVESASVPQDSASSKKSTLPLMVSPKVAIFLIVDRSDPRSDQLVKALSKSCSHQPNLSDRPICMPHTVWLDSQQGDALEVTVHDVSRGIDVGRFKLDAPRVEEARILPLSDVLDQLSGLIEPTVRKQIIIGISQDSWFGKKDDIGPNIKRRPYAFTLFNEPKSSKRKPTNGFVDFTDLFAEWDALESATLSRESVKLSIERALQQATHYTRTMNERIHIQETGAKTEKDDNNLINLHEVPINNLDSSEFRYTSSDRLVDVVTVLEQLSAGNDLAIDGYDDLSINKRFYELLITDQNIRRYSITPFSLLNSTVSTIQSRLRVEEDPILGALISVTKVQLEKCGLHGQVALLDCRF